MPRDIWNVYVRNVGVQRHHLFAGRLHWLALWRLKVQGRVESRASGTYPIRLSCVKSLRKILMLSIPSGTVIRAHTIGFARD